MRSGLIDEYRLVIQPVALGNGLPMFHDLPAPLRLELVEARTFPRGTAVHVYRPVTVGYYFNGAEVMRTPRCPPSRP
jgi:dihydrofolate reductase